jgi:hypothetical protein
MRRLTILVCLAFSLASCGGAGSTGNPSLVATPFEPAEEDFPASLVDAQLTLGASPVLPEQPVLYRIGRWSDVPASVAVDGAQITVNQGGTLTPNVGRKVSMRPGGLDPTEER